MFVVNDPPPQIAPDRLAPLSRAEPATIGHFRQVGFMDPGIRALWSDRRIAGTAVTVRFDGDDTSIVHYALGQLRPGDVLVIDRAGDTRHACCGGGVAFAAHEAGCIGIIIDGVATDIQELRAYAMPVWARGLSPITCKPRFIGGEFCVPISCGGVAVAPGDVVFADENGVLVMPPSDIETSARRAIGMQDGEKVALARVAKGEKFPDINGTNAKIREILATQPSR
jgi:4-hydroxy-4-methyl-2-oxoglutarate aldolase